MGSIMDVIKGNKTFFQSPLTADGEDFLFSLPVSFNISELS